MLSISAPLSTPDYVLSLARADYYTGGGEPPGRWFGSGAQALGLTGTVKPTVLRRLFRGLSPDGKRELVRNAVKAPKSGRDRKAAKHEKKESVSKETSAGERQGGWDATFSAPKSVSARFAIAETREEREAILDCHQDAITDTLAALEKKIGWSRQGKAGCRIVPAKLAFATFLHVTSRAKDPQIHSHCILLNIGVREDGTTGTLVTRELFRLKMVAGALYRASLARHLRSRLGYSIRAEKSWFEINGVPAKLIEAFSKRRKEVLAELDRMGKSDAVSAERATRATRRGKEMTPRPELYADWEKQARDVLRLGFDLAKQLFPRVPFKRAPLQLIGAVDALHKERSFFTREQLLLKLAIQHQTGGQTAERIVRGADRLLRNLVDLGVHEGVRLYTSPWVLEEEKRLLKAIEERRDDNRHRLPTHKILPYATKLGEEQQHALLHIVGTSGDVKVIQGLAGTGKSTLLAAARESWEEAGFTVMGSAYSGKAAAGLRESSGITSHTVDRLLYQWAKEESAVRRLDEKSILIVDEASMLDTLRLSTLLKAVRAAGARLVLVGDEKQLPPIQGCAPFSEIGRRLGRTELREIRRQKNGLLKMVVEQLADGDVSKALKLLWYDKLLHVHGSDDAARQSLVADWFKAKGDRLMLASTREDVADLNRRAHQLRKVNGELGLPMFSKEGTVFTRDWTWFRMHERLMFTRNDRKLGVQNGTIGTLIGFNPVSRIATIQVDQRKVFVPIDKYRHFDLAYCLTVHKAQGATVDRAFVLWGDSMQSREMTYVQASRARYETRFYLTTEQAGEDFQDALQDMERTVTREMAVTKERAVNLSPSI